MVGFEAQLYQLNEQADPHQLTIKVLTPPASLQSNVTLQVTAQSGNATGKSMHGTIGTQSEGVY